VSTSRHNSSREREKFKSTGRLRSRFRKNVACLEGVTEPRPSGRRCLGYFFTASSRVIQLTITAVKGVTKVNGKAVDGTKAVAGAMVLLLPHDPGHGNNITA